MEIRLENKDLNGDLMTQLQNRFLEELLASGDKLHKFYLYYNGECIVQGVMPKDVLLGTFHFDKGVSMYFESQPIEEISNGAPNKNCNKRCRKG